MQLVIIGLHQRTAPVAIRERLAFDPAMLPGALQVLRDYADEGFILSTCNRVEVYALMRGDEPADLRLRHFLAEWHALPPEEVAPHLYTYLGPDAVRHLFRLSAGLDSMVLGEDQITSQIKGAMQVARESGTLGPFLSRLVDHALSAGKLVRTQTGLSRSHLSVVSVALDLARQTFGCLSGRRFLVIGAGRMAELALKHIQGEGALATFVTSRTFERAQNLAARYGALPWPIEQLGQALRTSEVVISCTSAPGYVIDYDLVLQGLGTCQRSLLLLDLAVPRDIDRRVGTLPGVRLFDVDDMQEICAVNRATRSAEISGAEDLVECEVQKFVEWWSHQQVVPTIRALRERAEAIRVAELERTLARMPNLSAREQAAVQALSAAIINKLLHQPITTLKNPSLGGQLSEAVQQLFQLEGMREPHVVES